MTDGREGVGRSRTAEADPALEAVLEGLRSTPRVVSSKYFYDSRGSALFEEITRLPEYYPTRTERELLARCGTAWIAELAPAALVELGAGSARKSRILLDAMEAEGSARVYVPIDVSGDFLGEVAGRLREEYPHLEILPEVADMNDPLELPDDLPEPAFVALLGGTIGNFDRAGAERLIRRIAGAMRPRDRFLLGVDLRPGVIKSKGLLEAAYNDERGVTAAFNRNLLHVLNRRFGTRFDPSSFDHLARYDEEEARIEMHLVSRIPQEVSLPDGGTISFAAGETLRTEISRKFDRPAVEELLAAGGFTLERWCRDEGELFALALGRPPG
jgi:L-histidine Nalpha-methyltransferase